MPVTPTYPGIYIEELPFSTHTVQAAPTSIAAFIGYVNPWYTASPAGAGFGTAVPLASFSDYEANFGGMFTSGLVDPSLPRAVFQFFANGGSSAYVVGLEPTFTVTDEAATPPTQSTGTFTQAQSPLAFTASITATGGGLLFTAKVFTDQVPMALTVSNLRAGTASGALDTFDVVITYGGTIETYRGVAIGAAALANPNATPDATIGALSSLVAVAAVGGGYGTALPAPLAPATTTTAFTCPDLQLLPAGPLSAFAGTYRASDFIDALQPNASLDQVEIFNLLLVPGIADNGVQSAALAFAERKRAFAVLDPPASATLSGKEAGLTIASFAATMPRSQNGAIYFPWLQSTDPVTSDPIAVAPSGFVAGIYAATDTSRGVWKAPAGMATAILNTSGPVPGGVVTDAQHGDLNITYAVNCLRQFAAIGTIVFGARTLVGNNSAYAQSQYVPVRRMTLFLEQTLIANLRWAVFEPNDDPLWTAIRLSVESFMLGLWTQGALQGASPAAAFQVKCDSSTTTSDDQLQGIVNVIVAFAPLKPAEFVVIKIAQIAGQAAG
jgi:phage tail sheath protein FI